MFKVLSGIQLRAISRSAHERNSKQALKKIYHDSKVHGANMGPIWDRQGPGGPHVGPINFAIWVLLKLQGGANKVKKV